MANKPTETLRDGSLKATIWKQVNEKGVSFRVNLARSYRDSAGKWHDTDSFSGTELLRIARLANKAYDRIGGLRKQEGDTATPESTPNDGRIS